MSDEKKLTNKELLRFRREQKVKSLALTQEHDRTHTGTAVLRKLRMEGQYENTLDATPLAPVKVTPQELLQATLREIARLLREQIEAGVTNLQTQLACASVAAQYGLNHNQVPALVDDVLHYLETHHVRRIRWE